MNLENILNGQIFQNLNSEFIAIIVLSLICIVLLCLFIYEHKRVSRLLRGNNSLTIEDSILELARELDSLTEYKEESKQYLKLVEERLRKSVQAVETKRFNPFKGTGTGGNQSFASAFINENGDGLILSSLYSSDRMSVFAKPVHDFKPAYELSDEEAEALEKAKNKLI